MSAAELASLVASVTALLVAAGHVIADLTGLVDAVKARRAGRMPAAGGTGSPPPPAAQ